MYTVVYVLAKSNKQPLDNRSQKEGVSEFIQAQTEIWGGKCWLIFFSTPAWMCKYTQIQQSLKQCCLFENPPRLRNDSLSVSYMLMYLFLWWHFLSDTNAVILPSTFHSPPPSRISRWLGVQRRAPLFQLKWTMLLLAAAEKPLIVSQVSYLCQDTQPMLGGLPAQNMQYCALTWGSTFLQPTHGHTRSQNTKGLVVLLHPATRGCRQCAPITPWLQPEIPSGTKEWASGCWIGKTGQADNNEERHTYIFHWHTVTRLKIWLYTSAWRCAGR